MVAVMAVQLRVLLTSVHGGGEWQVSRKERIDSWDRVLSPPPLQLNMWLGQLQNLFKCGGVW